MGVWMGQGHGKQAWMLPLMMGSLQHGTTSPHENFRHQASCCQPPHKWTEAQAPTPQPAALKLHRLLIV